MSNILNIKLYNFKGFEIHNLKGCIVLLIKVLLLIKLHKSESLLIYIFFLNILSELSLYEYV